MEPTLLYLDTARLGRMTPRAQQAHLDFARLAGAEGGSILFERFVQHGAETWPGSVAKRYPGLAGWKGVPALKESLRVLAGSCPDLPVLLSSRSAELMRLAARLLFHPCRNVLTTDLDWPNYQDALRAACRRPNQKVTTVAVRDALLQGRLSEDEVVARLCGEFVRQGCDGLYLTAVSNLGLRLPVERIVRAVEATQQVWFIVIDGAQDFCHVSAELRNEYCDLYLAGCHKWLGAFQPMGLGFYGRRRSRGMIETVLSHLLTVGELDDPLLRFSGQLEANRLDGQTETVNLTPLFSCQGAVADALDRSSPPASFLGQRLENLTSAADLARGCGWWPLLPPLAFRTGILLLQAERAATRQLSAAELRGAFYECGVAVTTYGDGLARLSMGQVTWREDEVGLLRGALRSVA